MDESYNNLPTSHLLGSVPAVVIDETKNTTYEAPEANLQIFPPANNGAGSSGSGYQNVEVPTEAFEQQPANNWRGVFSVSSYQQYFNVDADVVLNRVISSMFPMKGDFFSKIDANPDLYGLVWISTTLVFVLAALGNCATYLMEKRTDKTTSWKFDVSYMNAAAASIYGYALVVPLAYYFLLQYLGANANLVRFWCMWSYSLFIFVPTSFLLLIPVEILRWILILGAGIASCCFVGMNLKSYVDQTNDLAVALIAAVLLQLALAIFIKVWFFA